jgi:hypothetical protein
VVGALAAWLGFPDPRAVSLVALALVVSATMTWSPSVGAGVGLLLPLAFGVVFAASSTWTLGGLVLSALFARGGMAKTAAVVFGLAAALDHRALAAAPLLAATEPVDATLRPGRRLALVACGYLALVLPVVLLDPLAFASALGRPLEIAPGLGLGNLLVYKGAAPPGAAALLKLASVAVSLFGLFLIGRLPPPSALAAAALLSLVALWLDPAPPALILALPLTLLALSAAGAATSVETVKRLT